MNQSPDRPAPRSFLGNAVALVVAALASQAINLGASLITARFYGPAEIGVFGLFTVAFTLATFAASWSFEIAIVTVDTDEEANEVAVFIIAAATLIAALVATAVILIELLPEVVAPSLSLRRALLPLPLALLFAGANAAGTNLAVRRREFARVSIYRIVTAMSTAAAQIGFFAFAMPASQLAVGFVVGQAAGLLVLSSALLRAIGAVDIRNSAMTVLWHTARLHRRHFFYTTPYSAVTQVYYQLPLILIGAFLGTKEVGYFSLAYRTTFVPMTLMPGALAQVFFPELARDRNRLGLWESRLLTSMLGIGVLLAPIVSVILVWGPEIYSAILGNAWRDAGLFAQVMICANLMNGLASGYDRVYFVLHRQRTALVVTLAVCVLSAVLMVGTQAVGASALWLVAAWSFGHVILAIAWMTTIYGIAGYSVRALIHRWVLLASVVASLSVAIWIGRFTFEGSLWASLADLVVVLGYGWMAARGLIPLTKLLRDKGSS